MFSLPIVFAAFICVSNFLLLLAYTCPLPLCLDDCDVRVHRINIYLTCLVRQTAAGCMRCSCCICDGSKAKQALLLPRRKELPGEDLPCCSCNC